MTDMTSQPPRRRAARPMGEYYAYWGLIFAVAVPVQVAMVPLRALGLARRTDRGPIRGAAEQANLVAPALFGG